MLVILVQPVSGAEMASINIGKSLWDNLGDFTLDILNKHDITFIQECTINNTEPSLPKMTQ